MTFHINHLSTRRISIYILLAFFLSSCSNLGVGVYYKIPGVPIKLSVDNNGSISLALDGAEVLTPIGIFGVDLDLHTPELLNKKVFVVRMKNSDTVYDLNQRTVTNIELEPGYYQAINLQVKENIVLLDLAESQTINIMPTETLNNATTIKVSVARRTCSQTAFKIGMKGLVVEEVRLRPKPFIPQKVDENWDGYGLVKNEQVSILDIKCVNLGSWLYVQRSNGISGWAKEWGVSNNSVETKYIIPIP